MVYRECGLTKYTTFPQKVLFVQNCAHLPTKMKFNLKGRYVAISQMVESNVYSYTSLFFLRSHAWKVNWLRNLVSLRLCVTQSFRKSRFMNGLRNKWKTKKKTILCLVIYTKLMGSVDDAFVHTRNSRLSVFKNSFTHYKKDWFVNDVSTGDSRGTFVHESLQ